MPKTEKAPQSPQTYPNPVTFARRLFELLSTSDANDIVSLYAPEQQIEVGSIVLINIGKTCSERCQPHYAKVTSAAYFTDTDATMIACNIRRFGLDDIAEPFVILKQDAATGNWQRTERSILVSEANVEDIPEFTA